MKEFVMIFRNAASPDRSPQQIQQVLQQWQDWMGNLVAQEKLASSGSRLGTEGKTVKPNNVVTDGPYAEIKEILGGFIVVYAANVEEAAELAKSCPILLVGGSVEVRNMIPMNG
jgi:hypothetical protein